MDSLKREFVIVAKPIEDVDGKRAFYCELLDRGMVVWAVNVATDEKITTVAPSAFRDIFNDLSRQMIDVEVSYAH